MAGSVVEGDDDASEEPDSDPVPVGVVQPDLQCSIRRPQSDRPGADVGSRRRAVQRSSIRVIRPTAPGFGSESDRGNRRQDLPTAAALERRFEATASHREQGNATTRPSRISLVRVAGSRCSSSRSLCRSVADEDRKFKPTTTSNRVDGGSGPISSDDVPAPTDVVVTPQRWGARDVDHSSQCERRHSTRSGRRSDCRGRRFATPTSVKAADLSGWTDCVDVRSIRNGVQSKAATGCPGGP